MPWILLSCSIATMSHTYALVIGVIVSIISFLIMLSLVIALVILLTAKKATRAKKTRGIDLVHSMSIFRQNSLSGLDKMPELMEYKGKFYATLARGTLEFPRKNLEWGNVIGMCEISTLDF